MSGLKCKEIVIKPRASKEQNVEQMNEAVKWDTHFTAIDLT